MNNFEHQPSQQSTIDTKLGELLLQGWTLLSDYCFLESCHTPLIRDNNTSQVYCVGCEAWVVNKEKRTKMEKKFHELVSLEGKRKVVLKENNELTIAKSKYSVDYDINMKLLRDVLEGKILEFSSWLQNEKDVGICNSILDAMKKSIGLLKEISECKK